MQKKIKTRETEKYFLRGDIKRIVGTNHYLSTSDFRLQQIPRNCTAALLTRHQIIRLPLSRTHLTSTNAILANFGITTARLSPRRPPS